MSRILSMSLIVAVVAVVAGCGGSADTPPVDESMSGPLLSCTRGEFDAFPEAPLSDDLLSRDELVELPIGAALDGALPEGGIGGEEASYSTADGFLILEDGVIGSVVDGQVVGSFYLEQDGSTWVLLRWGECWPRRIDGELIAEEWDFAPHPTAASQTLEITILGGMCSGTSIESEIVSIDVQETAETITVTVWTNDPTNDVEGCAGLATSIPATVALEAPVGQREILDGGTFPAAAPTRH